MWKLKKDVKPQDRYKIVINNRVVPKYPYKVCICGVIRDGEPYFKSTMTNLRNIGALFLDYKIVIIESDSKDNTVKLFSSVKDRNLFFQSMGSLEKTISTREERIAKCRNIYLKHVIKNHRDYDLMIVIDMDDVLQEEINPKIFETCMSPEVFPTWDGVFANQSYRYYDIWALRNDEVDYDCWEQINSGKRTKIDAILKHQYHIPKNTPYIPVISAFGGMGIYKLKNIDDSTEYNARVNDKIICEHVPFNTHLTSKGCQLFIDPSLVMETPPSFAKYYV